MLEYSKEYFQPKIGRKIRIFRLSQKNNIVKSAAHQFAVK